MKTTIRFTKPLTLCLCPSCNHKHWRKVFVEEYATVEGNLIVECVPCETDALAEWRKGEKIKCERHPIVPVETSIERDVAGQPVRLFLAANPERT